MPERSRTEPALVRIDGMSLRDLFAASALIGLMAVPNSYHTAQLAYTLADAMLVARENGQKH